MDNVKIAKELAKLAKAIISDDNDAELDKGFIEWHKLEKLIGDEIGTTVKLKVSINRNKFDVESQDLSSKAGIMSELYESLKIVNFGGGYVEEAGKKLYAMPLDFGWQYKKGGSNGTSVKTYWWDFEKKKWRTN